MHRAVSLAGRLGPVLSVVLLCLAVPPVGPAHGTVPAPRPAFPVAVDRIAPATAAAAVPAPAHPHGITPGIPPSYSWANLTPESSPPGRYGAAMAYDAFDGEILLFGGISPATAQPVGDTWAYANGAWQEVCPGNFGGAACDNGPLPGADIALTYDPNGSRIVAYDFGRGLTYGFSRGVWSNLSGPGRPPLQQFPSSIAYDPFSGRILLFSASGTTWEFAGENWTRVAVAGPRPAPRIGAVLFADPLLGEVVLTGGVEGSQPLNDTWEYRNRTWTEVATAVSPPGAEAAAFDSTYQDGAVLSQDPGTDALSLWGFSAAGWARITEVGSAAPAPSGEPALAFDGATGYLVLYWGGAVGTPYGLTVPSNTWAAVDAFTGENVSVSRPAVVVGDTFWIHVYAAGGVLPYTYTYAVLPPGCSGSSARAAVPCPTFETGTFAIAVTVRDSTYGSATLFNSIVVVPTPTASVISLTNPTTVDVPTTFEGFVTGGLPPMTFLWNFSDGNHSQGANATHAFGRPGLFNVTVSLVNATGVATNASLLEAVNPFVAVATVQAVPRVTDLGDPISFAAAVDGGTAPFSYAWAFGPGQGTGSGPDPQYAYTDPGKFTARVGVTDSVGAFADGGVTVVVNSDPQVAILANVPPFNLTVTLGAAIAGGTAPFTFIWSLGDGAGSPNASLTHTYAAAGTYEASVIVRDATGREVTQSINVTVEAPVPPPAVAWYNGTVGTVLTLFGVGGVGLGIFALVGARMVAESPPPGRRSRARPSPRGGPGGTAGEPIGPGPRPTPPTDVKMVLVLRGELRMSPVRAAVQAADAAVRASGVAARRRPAWAEAWGRSGQRKILLLAPTLAELEAIEREAAARGIPSAMVEEAGSDEVAPGTKTCLGLGPASASEIDPITGDLEPY